MQKLLFFTKMNFGISGSGGIKNKVFAQVKAFEELGLKTDLFYFENKNIILHTQEETVVKTTHNKISFLSYLYGGFLKKIDIRSYDYIYIRHFLTNPLFLILLTLIKIRNKKIKIFMEIPTFPYQFEFNLMSFKKQLEQKIDKFCTYFFRFFIDKIVTFSSKPNIFGIPTIKTDNGIDSEKFGIVHTADFDGKNLELLGLANVQPWHGLDRIINGLAIYLNTNPPINIKFHIVGSGGELDNLKNLVLRKGLSEHVIFHGFVTGDNLIAMFERCHVGIGSLGMHRINVAKGETSALKSREYASRGLPFVIAYEDRGFPEKFPLLLNLEASESAIDIQKIVKFYLDIQSIEKYSEILNQYAKDNLTWKAKLKPVVDEYIK